MKSRSLFHAVMLAAAVILTIPAGAIAQGANAEAKAAASIRDVLQANAGKRVALRMQSGEDIDGTVIAVGATTVHIARLAGKDFFDAVVSIDKISAVIFKAR